MSFILDALKKSESDRQRQGGPALFEVKVAPPRHALPSWAVAIAGLFLANLAVVGWLLWRHAAAPAPGPAPAAAPAAAPSAVAVPSALAALNTPAAAAAPAVTPSVRGAPTAPPAPAAPAASPESTPAATTELP